MALQTTFIFITAWIAEALECPQFPAFQSARVAADGQHKANNKKVVIVQKN
jgi:hypothetical protein